MKKIADKAGLFAFSLPFVIYLLTLCPTVHWGDSGELITAAYTLGIPHPPGHPLYAILGKLFTLIPVGSIAYRVNLMSAFFGAVTCYLIYKIICDRLGDSSWKTAAALGGAFFFAFAPTVWDQTTVAETTTLHSSFMMLLTLLGFRIVSGRVLWKDWKHSLYLFSFVYGVSMTNHVAGVLFVPAFVFLFLSTYGRKVLAPGLVAKMLLSFFAGLLIYAYLPIRSLMNPPLDWGNPENLKNFIWVVTARQFAPNLVKDITLPALLAHLALRARSMLGEFTVVGCMFGVIGVRRLFRLQRKFVFFSLLVIAVLFYVSLNKAFISAYFVPAIALISVWIGAGIEQVVEWAISTWERLRKPQGLGIARKAICGLLSVSFLLPLGLHFRKMDRSSDRYALRYGEQVLERMPQNSILFTSDGYALFILWYLTFCEGRRPDIMIVDPTWLVGSSVLTSQVLEQYPDLRMPAPEKARLYASRGKTATQRQYLAIQAILDENVDYRPVFWGIILSDLPFFDHLDCRGIVYPYSKSPVTLSDDAIAETKAFWNSELQMYQDHPEMHEAALVCDIYPVELNNQGLMFEELGRDDLSRWFLERALVFNPLYAKSHYNLGRLEARAGNYEGAIAEYRKAIEINPYMAVAYYNLGNACRHLERFDEAFLAYRNAVRFYKHYHEALTALGQLYALAGQHEDAIRQFRQALDIEPQYPFALRGLAYSYLALNRLDEAQKAIEKALEVEPDSAAGIFALAKYDARCGRTEQAENALRRSIQLGGDAFLRQAASDDDLKMLALRLAEARPSQ